MSGVTSRLLLISKRNEQSLQLQGRLSAMPGFTFQYAETAASAMSLIRGGKIDCIIFNFDYFGPVQVTLVVDLQSVAKSPQVLILADEVAEAAATTLSGESPFILIEKALLNIDKDIAGLCQRLIGYNEPVLKRESARFLVEQKATVLVAEPDKKFSAWLRDISEKGACLELNTNSLKIGQAIKVVINLEELERKRIIAGEIRWIKRFSARSLMGIKFTKSETSQSAQ